MVSFQSNVYLKAQEVIASLIVTKRIHLYGRKIASLSPSFTNRSVVAAMTSEVKMLDRAMRSTQYSRYRKSDSYIMY